MYSPRLIVKLDVALVSDTYNYRYHYHKYLIDSVHEFILPNMFGFFFVFVLCWYWFILNPGLLCLFLVILI